MGEEKVDRTTRLLKKFLGEFRFKEAQMIAENQTVEAQDDQIEAPVDGTVEEDVGAMSLDPDELMRRAMSRTLAGPRFAAEDDPADEPEDGAEEPAADR